MIIEHFKNCKRANDITNRFIFTVKLAENRFVDVMNIELEALFYVMKNGSGAAVYDGNKRTHPDYTVDEAAIIDFVKTSTMYRVAAFVEPKGEYTQTVSFFSEREDAIAKTLNIANELVKTCAKYIFPNTNPNNYTDNHIDMYSVHQKMEYIYCFSVFKEENGETAMQLYNNDNELGVWRFDGAKNNSPVPIARLGKPKPPCEWRFYSTDDYCADIRRVILTNEQALKTEQQC